MNKPTQKQESAQAQDTAEDTARAIRMEQSRETARSIHAQVSKLQRERDARDYDDYVADPNAHLYAKDDDGIPFDKPQPKAGAGAQHPFQARDFGPVILCSECGLSEQAIVHQENRAYWEKTWQALAEQAQAELAETRAQRDAAISVLGDALQWAIEHRQPKEPDPLWVIHASDLMINVRAEAGQTEGKGAQS